MSRLTKKKKNAPESTSCHFLKFHNEATRTASFSVSSVTTQGAPGLLTELRSSGFPVAPAAGLVDPAPGCRCLTLNYTAFSPNTIFTRFEVLVQGAKRECSCVCVCMCVRVCLRTYVRVRLCAANKYRYSFRLRLRKSFT